MQGIIAAKLGSCLTPAMRSKFKRQGAVACRSLPQPRRSELADPLAQDDRHRALRGGQDFLVFGALCGGPPPPPPPPPFRGMPPPPPLPPPPPSPSAPTPPPA